MCRVLMDNASSEYCFLTEFFSSTNTAKFPMPHSPAVIANELFGEVCGRTVHGMQDQIKVMIDQSVDAIGILLCIRINNQHQLIMQKRRIPCLDQLINALNLLLWPRF